MIRFSYTMIKKIILFLFLLQIFYPIAWSEINNIGNIQEKSGQLQINFDQGRLLTWTIDGNVVLKDAKGTILAKANLNDKVKKVGGGEAMGLQVDETDLGGSLPTSKDYLKNKHVVHGRELDASVGSVSNENSDIKSSETNTTQGIAYKKTLFSNGAYTYQISWPGETEELYFDYKGNIRWNKKTSALNNLKIAKTQWVDGSYTRQYINNQGSVNYAYDANDSLWRISVSNAQKDNLFELHCSQSCQSEDVN